MQTPSASIDHLLSQAKQVGVVGPQKLASRPLGQRFKKWMQQGALSLVLLAQMTQVFAAPQAPVLPSASPASIESVSLQHLDRLDEPVVFNPLSAHPKAQAYVQENGLINGVELIRHWRDAGVSESDMYNLTEVLLQTQSPVVAATHKELAHAKALSERTSGLFSIHSAEDAYNFLDKHNFEHLVTDGVLEDVVHTLSNREFHADQVNHVTFDMILSLWNNSSVLKTGMISAPTFAEDASRQEVTDTLNHLKEAVTQTGLSSLRVPLSMWTDAGLLDTVAHDLIQANHELQTITGWQGPVLGLNGRVSLHLGEPYDVAVATTSVTGGTLIASRMDSYAHEFGHAIEGNFAKDLGYAPQDYDMALLHEHAPQDQQHQFWNESVQAIENTSYQLDRSWYRSMDHIVKKASEGKYGNLSEKENAHLADYLSRPHERFAFAVMTYVASVLPESAVLHHGTYGEQGKNIAGSDEVKSPFAEHSTQQHQNWQKLFSGLNQNWWKRQIDPSSGMKNIVSETISSETAPAEKGSSVVEGSIYASIASDSPTVMSSVSPLSVSSLRKSAEQGRPNPNSMDRSDSADVSKGHAVAPNETWVVPSPKLSFKNLKEKIQNQRETQIAPQPSASGSPSIK